jgi:S-formylglutathione hydrolase FrmB
MSVEGVISWLIAGLGGGGAIVFALRVGLPLVRKLVPAAISVSGALEASRARLDASYLAEITEQARQIKVCREALAECEGRKVPGEPA